MYYMLYYALVNTTVARLKSKYKIAAIACSKLAMKTAD